jgi:hypothetical protein
MHPTPGGGAFVNLFACQPTFLTDVGTEAALIPGDEKRNTADPDGLAVAIGG